MTIQKLTTQFRSKFLDTFPRYYSHMVEVSIDRLVPFVDLTYDLSSSIKLYIHGEIVSIPYRIHVNPDAVGYDLEALRSAPVQCLMTRSTDGYIREEALSEIILLNEAWCVPFVVLLSGEYVAEIAIQLMDSISRLDRSVYSNFVRENRPLMRRLRARATSYWDCYYRADFNEKRKYPGLEFLSTLELWAG